MANQQYVDGGANVTGDDLNTFLQTAGFAADLRAFIGTTLANGSPMVAYLAGISAVADGGQGFFWWNPANTAADDNLNVIVPYGTAAGGWNRIEFAQPSTLTIAHKTANYSITIADSGTHFDTLGAGGTVTFVLPSAGVEGLYYCFAVVGAQPVVIQPFGSDTIAVGLTSTSVGGSVTASAGTAFSSICLECHTSGRWIVTSQTGAWVVS